MLLLFSDLRKPGLVPGKSLSLSTKIDSVLEKYLSYKEFHIVKRTDQQHNNANNTERNRKYPIRNADSLAPHMSHTDGQYMARIVQDVTELITLSGYAGAKAERCKGILAESKAKTFMAHTMT